MPEERPTLTRADLPDEFTPETIRALPLETLRQVSDRRSGILSPDEQRAFDRVLHEVMRGTAERVSRQLTRADWSTIRRSENARGVRNGRPSKADEQIRRLARRIGQQVDVAETLAPGVDWSFAQPVDAPSATDQTAPPSAAEKTPETTVENEGTVSDLEQRISEQVELVEVMSEIAEVSKRTYALEQQRDLQTTRGVFFGFVVSVAVLVAGWAPLVAADDWGQRVWIICLALGTCVVAGLVYALVRRWQNKHQPADDPEQDQK